MIWAEGAPAETFIDDDSRGMFHNGHEYVTLYPAEPVQAPRYCAPRCEEGYEVEAVRRAIALRAGLALDHDAGALRGYVELVSETCIAGWAQNTNHPEAPVCLDLYAGDRLIGQVLANRHRQDLEQQDLEQQDLEHAGTDIGRHAFTFSPEHRIDCALDAIVVRRSLDGAVLPPSEHARSIRMSGAA